MITHWILCHDLYILNINIRDCQPLLYKKHDKVLEINVPEPLYNILRKLGPPNYTINTVQTSVADSVPFFISAADPIEKNLFKSKHLNTFKIKDNKLF